MAEQELKGKCHNSYKVALIGSSGGGTSTLSSGELIIDTVRGQLHQIYDKESAKTSVHYEVDVCAVSLVIAQKGFDFITNHDDTKFWIVDRNTLNLKLDARGPLSYVNVRAKYVDEEIACLIRDGQIDALISISSDPSGINKLAVEAAIVKGIPIVGTGGTSIGEIATQGGNVVGCSGGSVATTALSRAIGCAASLSAYWQLEYKPSRAPLKLASIVGGLMPILLTASVLNFTLRLMIRFAIDAETEYEGTEYEDMFTFLLTCLSRALPAVISMVTCMESSSLQELSTLSGAVAGAVLSQGIVSSMLVGYVTGHILSNALVFCAKQSLLPTATTIIAIGCSSIFSSLLIMPFSPHIEHVSNMSVTILQEVPGVTYSAVLTVVTFGYERVMETDISQIVKQTSPIYASSFEGHNVVFLLSTGVICMIGGCIGWLCSVGSESGYYHSMMLPLIAFEMARSNGFSMLGSYDAVCLCMPAAGVCLGVWFLSTISCIRTTAYHSADGEAEPSECRNRAVQVRCHRQLGWKGFVSNMVMGDFVEACYPYTLASETYEVDVTETVLMVETQPSTSAKAAAALTHASTSAFTDVPTSKNHRPKVKASRQVEKIGHTNGSTNGATKNGASGIHGNLDPSIPTLQDKTNAKDIGVIQSAQSQAQRTSTNENFQAILQLPETMLKSMNDGVMSMAEYMNLNPSQQAEAQRNGKSPVPFLQALSRSSDGDAVRNTLLTSTGKLSSEASRLSDSPEKGTTCTATKTDGSLRMRKARFPLLLFFVRLSCFFAGSILFLGSAHLYQNKHYFNRDVAIKKGFGGSRRVEKSKVIPLGASGYYPVAITSSAYLPAPISVLLAMYGHMVVANTTQFGPVETPRFTWSKLRHFGMPKVIGALRVVEDMTPHPWDRIIFTEIAGVFTNATSNFNHAVRDASLASAHVIESWLKPSYDVIIASQADIAQRQADCVLTHSYYARVLYNATYFDTTAMAAAAYGVAFGVPFLASLVCLFSSKTH